MIPTMTDEAPRTPGWPAPPRHSIVELIADGVLDAELASLAWLLIEARLPVVVAALARGVGKSTLLEALLDFLPATIHADRLEEVHDELRARPIGASDDELSYLGLILILRAWRDADGAIRRRVVAAHYARPVGRDEHGHVQRLPPAVIAARDDDSDVLEHFAWGVMPELAIRVGRKAGDLELDLAERAQLLQALVDAGATDVDDARRAFLLHRPAAAVGPDHRHVQ